MRRFTLLLALILSIGAAQAQLVVTAEDSNLCSGDTVWFKASGMDTYTWTPAFKLDVTTGDSVNFETEPTDPNDNFNVMVVGIDTTLNDTDTVTINVRVNALPIINVISSASADNGFVCLGNSATLQANPGIPAAIATYSWSPDSTLDFDTAATVIATPTLTTDYDLVVTDTNGCQASTTETVSVSSLNPSIDLSAIDTIICPRSSTELAASAAGASFAWTPTATLSDSVGGVVTASPLTTTDYTVVARANGCDTFSTITIEVLPIPDMVVDAGSAGSICLDENAFVDIDCPGCVSYRWIFPNSVLETTLDTLTVSPNVAGDIEITILGFGENGCSALEVITIPVDSCFNGTPFGISDPSVQLANVYTNGEQLIVEGSVVVDQVEVFNLAGQKVYAEATAAQRSGFDVSALKQGMYVVLVKSGDVVESHKVMIP